MNSNYKNTCDKLIDNFALLKSSYRWENDLSKWLVALSYAVKNEEVDTKNIDLIKDYIKKETAMFSPFRGTSLFTLSGLLSLDALDARSKFDTMNKNYEAVKKAGFKQTSYIPIALYTLSQIFDSRDYTSYAEEAMDIYKEMKANHPFLTGGDDYALAILLIKERSKLDKIEVLYKALREAKFDSSNGLQMMSHILTFSDEPVKLLVERCSHIRDVLKKNKLRVYADYYAAIALLALAGIDSAVDDLVELALYLKSNKHAKWIGKGMVVMLASAIITSSLIDNSDDELIITSLKVSIQSIIMAQQAAMIAMIGASAAATSSS